MALVFTCKNNDKVVINDGEIIVTVYKDDGKVKLAIDAPRSVPIQRLVNWDGDLNNLEHYTKKDNNHDE